MSPSPETLNQLSRRLEIPTTWLRQEARAGRLPHLQAGRQILFDPESVNRVLVERAAQPPERQEVAQ